MKRWLALAWFLGLWALAAPLPQVYDRLEEALRQVRLENPTQALAALDRAQSLLRQESEGLPPVLRDATLLHLQDTRQAVLKQSRVDLEARLLLVRHLVGKALYDGFFQAPSGEKAAYLARLSQATGLDPAQVQGVQNLSPEEARRRLESSYLQLMAEDLSRALAAPSRPEAYLSLARAYARFLVIQDSPQSTLKAQDFVQALARVSGGESFRPEVQKLIERASSWRKALAPTPSSQTPAAPSPPPREAQPSSPPEAQKPASPAPTAPSPQAGLPMASPQLAPPQAPADDVQTFYTPPWMGETQARLVRQKALELGYDYNFQLLEALAQTQATVGLAITALGRGDAQAGRSHLDRASWQFHFGLEPVFAAIDPVLTEQVSRTLIHLSTATGIRASDALVVYEALEALRNSFSQGPSPNVWLQLKLWLAQTAGIPRAVFFLLASALSFFPLYLIQLTFGGRNVYWNLLGLAFLFLFLPIVAEGLSYFGSLMADYGNLPWLAWLANLSIGQGLIPYLAWGLTIFFVVALAGAGLRGIAAQFGLLRERGREVTATQDQRPSATTLTSETIVEWDEEF
ncbi:hypothetical protein [Thermus tengchongensis]|uniref:Uncharacterized protein n=1 Tax=Thermus tengchongensis TaxID=1214928 RepID=A0ABY2K5I1_9DEIN|nr:hypothetical protein [Thermus tengchongensis]TFU15772.1 hypothetical protein E0489_08480 [Thermus tengchongensis]